MWSIAVIGENDSIWMWLTLEVTGLMCAVNENCIMFLNVGMWLMNGSQILRAYSEINLWHFLCQYNPSKESKFSYCIKMMSRGTFSSK